MRLKMYLVYLPPEQIKVGNVGSMINVTETL